MTPYIIITIAFLGLMSAIPLVRYWERQDDKRDH